jgi:hypothetical protein
LIITFFLPNTKKKIKAIHTYNFLFLKKIKDLKFSFLFSFLLKKKNYIKAANFNFFFFNNLYFNLFKKIFEIIYIYNKDIVILFDNYSNELAKLNDLNFFLNKKNYIYFRLVKFDKKTAHYVVSRLQLSFFFFFTKCRGLKYLKKSFNNLKNICGLIDASVAPNMFSFLLPVVFDFNFSVFFYKFLIFNAYGVKV